MNISTKAFDWVYNLRRHNTSYAAIPRELLPKDNFDLDKSSLVMPIVWWAIRNAPEAYPQVYTRVGNTVIAKPDHIASKVLAMPSPPASKYDRNRFLAGIVTSLLLKGTAYILPGINPVTGYWKELYWEPHWRMTPKYDPKYQDASSPIVSYYERNVNGKIQTISPEFVIQISMGVDVDNPLEGLNPTASVAPWAAIDHEAIITQLAVIKQRATKTTIISPDGDGTYSEVAATKLQGRIQNSTTGTSRGRTIVVNKKLKAQEFGASLDELVGSGLADTAEKRACATYGLPRIVAGLIDDPKFSNYGIAKRLATEDFLSPLWRIIEEALTHQFLPNCGGTRNDFIAFNTTGVRSLQNDENELHVRVNKDYMSGVIKLSEARAVFGKTTPEEEDGYYHEILARTQAKYTPEVSNDNPSPIDGEDLNRDGPGPRRDRDRRLRRDGNGADKALDDLIEDKVYTNGHTSI